MRLNLDSLSTPLSLRPSVPLTDEELMRFSEENKVYKIERNRAGEITIMTPVGGIGSTHEAYVANALYNWNEKSGTGIAVGSNAGFNLPDGSCLAPDACWTALSRWEDLKPEQRMGYPPLCPDFVIEVRSRTDPRRLLEAKMDAWMENGAQLAWLVDPVDKRVVVYRKGEALEALDRPESVAAGMPVEGFVLGCGRLWVD